MLRGQIIFFIFSSFYYSNGFLWLLEFFFCGKQAQMALCEFQVADP